MEVGGAYPGQVELPPVAEAGVGAGLVVEWATLDQCEGLRVCFADRQAQAISALNRDVSLTDRQ